MNGCVGEVVRGSLYQLETLENLYKYSYISENYALLHIFWSCPGDWIRVFAKLGAAFWLPGLVFDPPAWGSAFLMHIIYSAFLGVQASLFFTSLSLSQYWHHCLPSFSQLASTLCALNLSTLLPFSLSDVQPPSSPSPPHPSWSELHQSSASIFIFTTTSV